MASKAFDKFIERPRAQLLQLDNVLRISVFSVKPKVVEYMFFIAELIQKQNKFF